MKLTYTKLVVLVAVGLPGLFLGTVRGVSLPESVNVITISATALVQNENVVDNGTNTVTPAPIVRSLNTKDLLKRLALDKYAQGTYGFTNFPSGAKLVVFGGSEDFTFEVWGKTNNLLVDVSDILDLEFGDISVFSGRENNATGLANSTITDRGLGTLSFDDTDIAEGGNIQFFLSGIFKSITIDTKPSSSTGVYTETQAHTVDKAIGEGYYQGSGMVISGSIKAGGKSTLQLF